MIFSIRRPQYYISHTKSQRLLVARHRLSCEKVNLHNTLITWAVIFQGKTTLYWKQQWIYRKFMKQFFICVHSLFTSSLNFFFRLSFCNCKSCVYNCDDLPSYNSLLRSSHRWFSYIHNFKNSIVITIPPLVESTNLITICVNYA